MQSFRAPNLDRTIGEMIDLYQQSPAYRMLAAGTRENYARSLARMRVVFGAVALQAWAPAWGQHYLAQKSQTPAAGNYDLAVLSAVFSAAVREGLLAHNPCREVRRHPAPPRDRYVADSEVRAFRAHCTERANAYVDLKLSTGARQGQLAVVAWSDWDGETLFIKAAKGGKDTQYGGPGVRAALGRCARAFHGLPLESAADLDCPVIVTRAGKGYRGAKHMISSLWHPAMKRYTATGAARFHEHDLRAKVASDSPNLSVAQERLGHQTSTITQRVYRRAPRLVESVDIRRSRQPDLFDETMGAAPVGSDDQSQSAGVVPASIRPASPVRAGRKGERTRGEGPSAKDGGAASSSGGDIGAGR